METWQKNLWREALTVDGVMPGPGGLLLAIGDTTLMGAFPKHILVEHLAWGAPLGGDMGYDRLLLLAAGAGACVDCGILLQQAHKLVRPDGKLIIIAARPWPWGLPESPWYGGLSARRWLRLLRSKGWLVERCPTVGFEHDRWRNLLPEAGLARVLVARKKPVGGSRVRLNIPKPVVGMKPVGA